MVGFTHKIRLLHGTKLSRDGTGPLDNSPYLYVAFVYYRYRVLYSVVVSSICRLTDQKDCLEAKAISLEVLSPFLCLGRRIRGAE